MQVLIKSILVDLMLIAVSKKNVPKDSIKEKNKPTLKEPIYALKDEVNRDPTEAEPVRTESPDIVGESIPKEIQMPPILSPSAEDHLHDISETMIANFEELEYSDSVEPFSTVISSPRPTNSRKSSLKKGTILKRSLVPYNPPDGGWGWICVAVCFLDFFLIDGLARSYGAIYDDIRREYPSATHSEVAMAPSVFTTLYIGLGIVAGALSQRFSFRSVAFAGGLACGISISLCYFASNLLYLTMCFVFAGIGSAMVCTNSMLAVAMYFRKRRALATGLSISGTSIGSMVQPPVVKYLTQLFGFRIALTCLGVVFLLAAPTALLLRSPISDQVRRSLIKSENSTAVSRTESLSEIHASVYLDREIPSHPAFSTENLESALMKPSSETRLPEAIMSSPASINLSPTPPATPSPIVSSSPTPTPVPPEPLITRSASAPKKLPTAEKIRPIIRKKHQENNQEQKRTSQVKKQKNKDVTKIIRFKDTISIEESSNNLSPAHQVSSVSSESSTRTWSFKESPTEESISGKRSGTSNTSAGYFLLFQFRTHGEARYAVYEQMTQNKCLLWTKTHCYLDFAFMKNPVFLVVFISAMMIFCAYPSALIFLVPYISSKGVDETIASLLISVSAAGDLISRLCSGALLDKAVFPKQYAFIAGMAVLGSTTISMLFNNHVAYLAILAAIYGLSTGLCILSIPILLADHHGAQNLPSVYGIIRLGMAFMCLVSPPVSGGLRDATGTFIASFVFMGGGTLIGTVIAMTMPYIKRRYRRKVENAIHLAHQRGEHFYLQ